MSRSVERQGQQWPHRVAALQQRPPAQQELPFDGDSEWSPAAHGLSADFDPFDDLGEHRRRHAAPTDWSRVRPGPLVDIPPREQDPDDAFATRPYSGPVCQICNRPPQWVAGPTHRHARIRRVRLAVRRIVSFDDWEPNQWGTGFESRLENGHSLFVVQSPQKPDLGWQWGIYDHNHPDPDVRNHPVRKGGQLWGGSAENDPQDHLPTAEHAKRQAIEHYKQMFPIGTDTGGHDSGVDYSDLNSYLRHLSRRLLRRIAMPVPTSLQLSNEQPEHPGTHGMQVYQDEQGDWSLKQPKPNLAFTVPLEAAAATLQRQMGLEAPETHVIDHGGRPAVVSKWYPNSTQAFQKPPRLAELSPDDQMTIQKNHVLDWLIGNHDSHVGNWMRTADGKLVSIDKGQAAKYFGHDRLDPHFHPNYYAREPIYNQLYRDHAKGYGTLHDPRSGELGDFVRQVQSIPDEHLKEMFRPYASAAAQSGLLANPDRDPSRELGPRTLPANDPEAFLDALVARKNNLHHDLGDYHDRMSSGRQLVGYRARISRELADDEEWAYPAEGVADELNMTPERFDQLHQMPGAPAPTHTVNGVPHWNENTVQGPWRDFDRRERAQGWTADEIVNYSAISPEEMQRYLKTHGSPLPSGYFQGEPGWSNISQWDNWHRLQRHPGLSEDPDQMPRDEGWMNGPRPEPHADPTHPQLELQPWQDGELPRPQRGNFDPNFERNNGYVPYHPDKTPGPGVLWQGNGRARQWWMEDSDSLAEWRHQLQRQPGTGQMSLYGDPDYVRPPDYPEH